MSRLMVMATALTAVALAGAVPTAYAAEPGPSIGGPGTVTLPWHGCYDVDDVLSFRAPRGTRIIEWSATLRKSGVSLPVGGNELCGYMGSGRYTASVRMGWQEKQRVRRTLPIMAENPSLRVNAGGTYEVRLLFTCSALPAQPAMTPGNVGAFYRCQLDTPVPEYSVLQALMTNAAFDAEGTPEGATASFAYLVPGSPADAALLLSGPDGMTLPSVFTGTAYPDLSRYEADSGAEVPLEVQIGTRQAVVTQWSKVRWTRVAHTFNVSVALPR